MFFGRLYDLSYRYIAYMAILLYIFDSTLAALDGYVPGDDYPIYNEVPKGLSFTCQDKIPGYYADPETQCQVWHWCVPSIGGNIMYSFICAPGTVFNQRTRVCDWFFKVDCPNAQAYYGINEDLYKDEAGNFIVGKKVCMKRVMDVREAREVCLTITSLKGPSIKSWNQDGRIRRKARKTGVEGQAEEETTTERMKGKNFICAKKHCRNAFVGLMKRQKKVRNQRKTVTEEADTEIKS